MKYGAEHAGDVFCGICRQLTGAGTDGSRLSAFFIYAFRLLMLSAGCAASVWLTWRFFTGAKKNLMYAAAAGICFLAGAFAVFDAMKQPVLTDGAGAAWSLKQLDEEIVQGTGVIRQISEEDGTVTLLVDQVRLFTPCEGNFEKSLYLEYEADGVQADQWKTYGDENSESGANEADERKRPGQRIRFKGTFSRYQQATNPGAFDYREYCWSLGIAGLVETSEKQLQVLGSGSLFRHNLQRLRSLIKQRILQLAQPEDAGILVCLLTGDKSELSPYWKELYQESGIIHLLTISGLHISILGMGMFQLLRKLLGSFFWSSMLSGILTGTFCVMAGSGTSMVRAMVCFFLFLLAGYLGRTYDFLTAVAVSGLLLLWEHPLLLFQSGLLMTFSCVLGIGTLLPLGELIFVNEESEEKTEPQERKRSEGTGEKAEKWKIRLQKTVLGAVLLQLSSLPVVLWFQGQVPVAGVLINLITVPFMSFVLISDILAVAGSLIFMPVGIFLLGTAHYILRWYEQVCLFFGSLPCSVLVTGRPCWWQVVLWILILSAVMGAGYYQVIYHHRKLPFAAGLLLLPCAVLLLQRFPDPQLLVNYLDVGQGDGIVVELPYGKGVFCIDGGSSSQKKLKEYVYEPYFAHEGIHSVDCWLLTHPDSDHYSGMIAMLEDGFSVKRIMMPSVFRDSELAAEIEALHPVDYIEAGKRIEAGEIQFEILHPAADYSSQDENDASAVVYLQWNEFSALFTGDMSLESEDEVLNALDGREVDVLKVAHHGSRTATSEAFLQAIGARTAVISCGINNRYGHPHKEVTERLKKRGIDCFGTSMGGCIRIRSDGSGYEAETFLENRS